MSDAPAAAPAVKAPAKKKTSKPKVPAAHPKYTEMIVAAISSLKERGGSSRQAIQKYIMANYKVGDNCGPHLKMALKKMAAGGQLKQVKGTGASGSFRVGEAAKKPAKKVAKKPAAKSPKKPKKAASPKKAAAKKPAAKKPAAKKPAAKKPAKSPKKAATKKPAAKKPAAKKPAAKKSPKKAAAKKPAKK